MSYLYICFLLFISVTLSACSNSTIKSDTKCPCSCPKDSPKKCKLNTQKNQTQSLNPTVTSKTASYSNSTQLTSTYQPPTQPNSQNSTIHVTLDEFKEALTSNGYSVGGNITDQYNGFIVGISGSGISSKTELAMFYAEIMWESGGLQYMSEIACTPPCSSPNCCEGNYGPTYNGNVYYGRGYMQLSWQTNYEAASSYLFGDPGVLRDNPNLVSTNQTVAWGTAFWYWKTHVHDQPGISDGKFGVATKAINGPIECTPPGGAEQAHKRFTIYVNIFKAWELPGTPNESGCYN